MRRKALLTPFKTQTDTETRLFVCPLRHGASIPRGTRCDAGLEFKRGGVKRIRNQPKKRDDIWSDDCKENQ